MPEKIGFIGLGIMGRPMAKNLMKNGYSVVCYDLFPKGIEDVVAAGATAGTSNADVASKSDIIITMVPDSPDVEAAYMGAKGVLEGCKPGQIFIDMSSISPVIARKVAKVAEEKGCEMIDAPVSGGEVGAVEASLSIMVGGKEDVFAKVQPILACMGKNIKHVGDAGAGQVAKAANQVIVAVTIQAVAEALTLAQKAGVDPAKVREALMGGFASSRILEVHGKRMVDRTFKPGFRIRLHLKDLNVALSTGREYGVSLPATGIVNEMMKSLAAWGDIDADHSALIKVVEKLSNSERPSTNT